MRHVAFRALPKACQQRLQKATVPILVLTTSVVWGGAEIVAGSSTSREQARLEAGVTKPARWSVTMEIAFGDGAPQTRKFKDLYALPYATNEAISREVLEHLLPLTARATQVRSRSILLGPGGYQDYPLVPSARWEIEATPSQLVAALQTLGYLAGQSEILAFRPDSAGPLQSVTLHPVPGFNTHDPRKAAMVWGALRNSCPFVTGFAPALVTPHLRPALQVVDTAGAWGEPQLRSLEEAARTLQGVGRLTRQRVRLQRAGNNWKRWPAGQNYLRNLTQAGNGALAGRLPLLYRSHMEKSLANAYRKHAPAGTSSARPAAYAPGTPPAIIAAPSQNSHHGPTHSH